MKKMIALMIMTMIFALSAAMEEYDRKSISIFKMDVTANAMSIPQQDVDMIYQKIFDKFLNMGRFDYNPIPVGVNDPAELFRVIKEYTITKIEERAAKQWDIKNEYYGSNFITGENVDKIINGAYIFFPRLENYVLTKDKTGDGFTAMIGVAIDIYSAVNTGTPEAPVWEPKLETTVRATGSSTFSNLFDLAMNDKKKDKRAESVKSATDGMLLFLEKEVKKIDVFKIKALVTKAEVKKDEISFNFGKNVGVNMDDAYTVGFFEKDKNGKEKYVETGFMKIRKIKDKESVSQLLIVNSQKGTKEADLFNEYDQVYEYPLVGLNIFINGGVNSFKFWGDLEAGELIEDQETDICPFIGLNMEYDIAKFVQVPELYFDLSADLLLAQLGAQGDTEFETTTAIVELGITKKFFKRQLGWYVGGDFGYMAMTFKSTNDNDPSSDADESYYAMGGKIRAGINYLINKNLIFDAGAGFRFYSELFNEDDDEVFQLIDDAYGTEYAGEGWLTPTGFVFRAGIGYTL